MIKVGDRLPEATHNEVTVEYSQGCPTGPAAYKVSDLTRGKHLPGDVDPADRIKARI